MATAGATRNYRNGIKNNWRRTMWNEVLRRTDGREKHEPILYLAGPQDIDRQIAIEKGVPLQHLIAIDRSHGNVDRIRKEKMPALHADVYSVLRSWPNHRPVCAVLLDLCGGLTEDVVRMRHVFMRPCFRNTIVMVNLQRGRDTWSEGLRGGWVGAVEDRPGGLGQLCGGAALAHLSNKHRALQFVLLQSAEAVGLTVEALNRGGVNSVVLQDVWNRADVELKEILTVRMLRTVCQLMSPVFFSYPSITANGGHKTIVMFDSVVFEHMAHSRPHDTERAKCERDLCLAYKPDTTTARSISAMLAVRTGRLSAHV